MRTQGTATLILKMSRFERRTHAELFREATKGPCEFRDVGQLNALWDRIEQAKRQTNVRPIDYQFNL